MGPYIKYDRNLEGGGWGGQIAVSISNSEVMLFSNHDIILQSEGGGGEKAKKCSHTHIMYDPATEGKKYSRFCFPFLTRY